MWQRMIWGTAAIACLAVLGVAAWLTPDPAGMGTHHQLGMHACGFLERTGMPCATCGMTTSFSHFAHGQIVRSFFTQPMGFMLALLTAATVWVGAYIAFTGVPAWLITSRWPKLRLALGLIGFGIAAWAYKIVLVIT